MSMKGFRARHVHDPKRAAERRAWLMGRAPALNALAAAFRMDSEVRNRHTKDGSPEKTESRDAHLGLFFTLLAATDGWPRGCFADWLDKKRKRELACAS